MRARFTTVTVVAMLACGVAWSQQFPKGRQPAGRSPSAVFLKSAKATVMIIALDAHGRAISQASGFFFAPEIVVTNLHALKWASSVVVKPYSMELRIPVEAVLGIDLMNDLCMLEVAPQQFGSLKLAVTQARVGDPVYVIGNPMGLEGTLSTGIVSAVRGQSIQIDAPISPGSSGGPVLNGSGNVVGIASSYLAGGQNLNFAVSARLITTMPRRLALTVKTAGAAAISDLEYRHLKGRVESYKETVSEIEYVDGAPIAGLERVVRSERFDEYGALVDDQGETAFPEILRMPEPPPGFELDDESESQASQDIGAAITAVAGTHLYSTTESGVGISLKLDAHGNEVELITGKKRRVTKYDDDDRAIETQAYYDVFPDFSIQYTYRSDAHGNWTRKEECYLFENFRNMGCRPTSVYKRSVSYFPEP